MTLTFDPIPVPLYMDDTGTVRVSGTRVILDLLISGFKRGERPEDIVSNFPSVPLPSVYAIIAYYLLHQQEVDGYLEQRRRQAEALRAVLEARYDKQAIRERLLERRAKLEAERHAATDHG